MPGRPVNATVTPAKCFVGRQLQQVVLTELFIRPNMNILNKIENIHTSIKIESIHTSIESFGFTLGLDFDISCLTFA
jgi:hypothetical protein